MAAVAVLETTVWNTTAGNKTITATPTAGDLIVIVAPATGVATSSVTDDKAGGTYAKISSSFTGFSTAGDLSIWIRNALITTGTAVSTVTLAHEYLGQYVLVEQQRFADLM